MTIKAIYESKDMPRARIYIIYPGHGMKATDFDHGKTYELTPYEWERMKHIEGLRVIKEEKIVVTEDSTPLRFCDYCEEVIRFEDAHFIARAFKRTKSKYWHSKCWYKQAMHMLNALSSHVRSEILFKEDYSYSTFGSYTCKNCGKHGMLYDQEFLLHIAHHKWGNKDKK